MNDTNTAVPVNRVQTDSTHRVSSRIRWIAFGASVAAHVLVILLYPLAMRRLVPKLVLVPPSAPRLAEGMRLVELVEIVDPAPEAVEPEDEERSEPEPAVEPEALPGASADPDAPVVDQRTAAEMLTPTMNHKEVWRFVDPELSEISLEDRIRLQLAGALEEWNDSVGAATEAARAAVDWTHTDADGGRWGVSPGRLHLGNVSIPLPFGFGPNPGRMDEVRQRDWEWDEIERAAATGAVRQSWKERNRAIRARREGERADTIPPPR